MNMLNKIIYEDNNAIINFREVLKVTLQHNFTNVILI